MNAVDRVRPAGDAVFELPPVDLARVVATLEREDAMALHGVLSPADCARLLAGADELAWRDARVRVGRPPNEVQQFMQVCSPLPANSAWRELTRAWQAEWDEAVADAGENPFEGRLLFNDLMLQRYATGPVGITPHRDRTGYRNLVCLFVLAGKGRFCVCEDRGGRGAREIPESPGCVLLMRAPGFLGTQRRPFHFVERIESPRYVFGLRHEVAPPGQDY